MTTQNLPEKRSFERMNIDHHIRYQISMDSEPKEGFLGNASASGVLLWLREDIPIDSRLHIIVHSEDPAELPLSITAVIVRLAGQRDDGCLGYGCKIVETADV
jgi:hypothetical protein